MAGLRRRGLGKQLDRASESPCQQGGRHHDELESGIGKHFSLPSAGTVADDSPQPAYARCKLQLRQKTGNLNCREDGALCCCATLATAVPREPAQGCPPIAPLLRGNSMNLFDYPIVLCLVLLLTFWLSALGGSRWGRVHPINDEEREDFGLIQAATLTLLGLIIGFSFSMATGRYDQRKNYEEAEANAIGTAYVRADLLPTADAARVRDLLRHYLDLRIAFYQTRSPRDLQQIDAETTQIETQLWHAAQAPAAAQPTPVTALAVTGMNDVLNSQGYTQAAWWNRLPPAAWGLMIVIAICCNLSVGYGMRGRKGKAVLLLVLPLFVSVALLLIADIDSPRGGFIRVPPENLINLSHSLPQ